MSFFFLVNKGKLKLKILKCLCCNQSFIDQFSLKEPYVTCHNVDENNYFFRKLFRRNKF